MIDGTAKLSDDTGPWGPIRLALHEVRSPITVIAYATEVLLEAKPVPGAGLGRHHLESIRRAAHEAATTLSILSRLIDVEQAIATPRIEWVAPGIFQDPASPRPVPPTDDIDSFHADARLARHMAASLWDVASAFPAPRARMISASLVGQQLVLRCQGPGSVVGCLASPSPRVPAPSPFVDDPGNAIRIHLLAAVFHRALEAMGGRTTPPVREDDAATFTIVIPGHAPFPKQGQH